MGLVWDAIEGLRNKLFRKAQMAYDKPRSNSVFSGSDPARPMNMLADSDRPSVVYALKYARICNPLTTG
jgi:hypothetical protein